VDYAKDLSPFVPIVAIILSVGAFSLSAYQFFETRRSKRSEREKDLRLKEMEVGGLIEEFGEPLDAGHLPPWVSERGKVLEIEIKHIKKILGKKDE